MPRDLPLSNGSLLVAFDREYRLREFFFPRVGQENQTIGRPSRFGVFVEGKFAWVGDGWQIGMDYEDDTMVTWVVARNHDLQVELTCSDTVDFLEDVYLRRVCVKNLAGESREIRLFFHQDFCIREFESGDTAYMDPELMSMIHYKDTRYFGASICQGGEQKVAQWAAGQKGRPGMEGTWRDAEEGVLSGNGISQGSTDSVIAAHVQVGPGESEDLWYWIVAGRSYGDMCRLTEKVLERAPGVMMERTRRYWFLWLRKDQRDLADLPQTVGRLFYRSLLILRTQIDNGGAIIAANDSDILAEAKDSYSYMWPRDGALTAVALDLAGYPHLSAQFFQFCAPLIAERGCLLHKYNPNGSLGSSWHPWMGLTNGELPIQEDETALVIWALWHHFERYRDVEAIRPLFGSLIEAAYFLVRYRDPETGLPLPSFDPWEERRGIITYTCAAVYAGLQAAARFSSLLGVAERTAEYRQAAEEVREAVNRHLWSPEHNRYLRMLTPEDGRMVPDATVDSNLAFLPIFGLCAPDDPRMLATEQAIREHCAVCTPVGGIARYTNDWYGRVTGDDPNVPGNPWIICTLWLADLQIMRAQTLEELEQVIPTLEWVAARALKSGVLAEQLHPYTGAPLSVSPLTWSHAQVVTTVQRYLDRREALCEASGLPYRVQVPWHAQM